MNLYYAMGGGLGHLTRAVAFLHQLGIADDSIILSSSPFLSDIRITGNSKTVSIDKEFENDLPRYQRYLQNLIDQINPNKIFIDSFPLGIIGEFNDFIFEKDVELYYLARRLRWINYLNIFNSYSINFSKTFLLEPLEFEHQLFVQKSSTEIINFDLNYALAPITEARSETFQTYIPYWLIVHSGKKGEIEELVDFAVEMREMSKSQAKLILISPTEINNNIPNYLQLDLYPALPLFAEAERIITGCGFNVMKQTEKFRHKHFFIPFERRYDDQYWRAAQRRKRS